MLSYVRKELERRHGGDAPLRFLVLSEEERSIGSFLDFLVACLRAVRPERLAALWRLPRADAEPEARRALLDEVGAGTTVLAIENLAEVFRGLGDDLGRLRAFLQGTPSVCVLASTCELFVDSGRADHPFYGFFHVHPLEPLDEEQAADFLSLLVDLRGDRELARALAESENRARVRVIHQLTGGSHRLHALLAGVLTPGGFDDLVEPFVRMVDRVLTPYYQQRLDRLSPQQNRVLDSVAGFDGRAASVAEIAVRTFLTPQAVTRLLHDLVHAGLVRRHSLGRESAYELTEPLLRWALDMKRGGAGGFDWIVRLLRLWYEREELVSELPFAASADPAPHTLYVRNPEALAAGLLLWLRQLRPLSPGQAPAVAATVAALRREVAQDPDALRTLDIVDAVVRDALGERGALLAVPVELRSAILGAG